MGPNGAYILREILRACTSHHHRLASLLSRHAKSIGFFCSLVSRTRVEEEEGYVYLTRIRRGRSRKRCSMLIRSYSRIPDVFSCLLSCTIFLLAPPPPSSIFLFSSLSFEHPVEFSTNNRLLDCEYPRLGC